MESQVVESQSYTGIFEGRRFSNRYFSKGSGYDGDRWETDKGLELFVTIVNKKEGKIYKTNFKMDDTGISSAPKNIEGLFFPSEKSIIPERREILVDYVLGKMVQQMEKESGKIPESMPTPKSVEEAERAVRQTLNTRIYSVSVFGQGHNDLVRRGFLYNSKGEIETLFPITSEEIPESRETLHQDIPL